MLLDLRPSLFVAARRREGGGVVLFRSGRDRCRFFRWDVFFFVLQDADSGESGCAAHELRRSRLGRYRGVGQAGSPSTKGEETINHFCTPMSYFSVFACVCVCVCVFLLLCVCVLR